jgi:hypothetical protein
MVFFGRFVALLRALAALLARANNVPWERLLIFNAAGGVCWDPCSGLGRMNLAPKRKDLPAASASCLSVSPWLRLSLSRFLRRNGADLLRRAEAAIAGQQASA